MPYLEELELWQFETSTPKVKQGVKLYKTLALGSTLRSIADQVPTSVIMTESGIDALTGVMKTHHKPFLEAEPEVQAEITLYQTQRDTKLTFTECFRRYSRRCATWSTRSESVYLRG